MIAEKKEMVDNIIVSVWKLLTNHEDKCIFGRK